MAVGDPLSADKRRCAPLIILPSIRCALNSESNVFTGRLLIEKGTAPWLAAPVAAGTRARASHVP